MLTYGRNTLSQAEANAEVFEPPVIATLEQEVAADEAQRARFSARAADSTSEAAAHPRAP